MSDNWVVQNLENALETWNEKLSEIWTLITTTPQNFKGGNIWKVIVDINGAVQAIGLALHVNKEYLKEPDYPYTEHDLMRFLFKLDDSIEVKIRPVILNEEDPEYTTTGIYFGSEAILRIRNMLEQWQEMKEKYENNEITKEALQDWKANYPDSLKKDYVPFEESNVKFYKSGINTKIPPDIK